MNEYRDALPRIKPGDPGYQWTEEYKIAEQAKKIENQAKHIRSLENDLALSARYWSELVEQKDAKIAELKQLLKGNTMSELQLKRFLVFGHTSYYPAGGWNDLYKCCATLEEAKEIADQGVSKKGCVDASFRHDESTYVIDLLTGEEVYAALSDKLKAELEGSGQ